MQLAQKSLLGKARERPDLVKQVLQKVKTEGLLNTANAVRSKLDSDKSLGYSAAGIVIDAGADITAFRAGDRIACAGAGFASHAELLSVPQNLCAHLPAGVSFEEAAFGTLGAIALQGVRLAEPTLGESVVVIGLGLIGQLTVQLLKANGCRVFGIDLDPERVKLAQELGADAGAATGAGLLDKAMAWSRGRGADAVLIAAATSSNEPVELAAKLSRLKGRVVAVGAVGLDIPRQPFYERELTLKISMSYGPGRYDPEYEERGHDYPFAYVRWTEQRNIEAFLDLVAQRRIDVQRLVTHRFPIEDADKAYELIGGEKPAAHLGVMLTYDEKRQLESHVVLRTTTPRRSAEAIRVGVIGAGSYVTSRLLPHFKSAGVEFSSIATASGITAQDVGKKFGFLKAVPEAEEVLSDSNIDLLIIGTRHDTHAELAARGLEEGRHVFVEKPLALNDEQLDRVLAAAAESPGQLLVGFNRRFSPLAIAGKNFFADRHDPLSILYRVNSGRIGRDKWIQDPVQGGGRIIGEVCHFIDLMQFWVGAPPVSVFANSISATNHDVIDDDSVFITLRFADGSTGCIAYLSEGDKSLAKERIEVFGAGKTLVLDDFRSASFFAAGRERKQSLRTQDKGQAEQVRLTCEMVRSGLSPIALEELAATTRATFRTLDSLRTGQPQPVLSSSQR
jgi:polar amino acid transport system substrate-binding protein